MYNITILLFTIIIIATTYISDFIITITITVNNNNIYA